MKAIYRSRNHFGPPCISKTNHRLAYHRLALLARRSPTPSPSNHSPLRSLKSGLVSPDVQHDKHDHDPQPSQMDCYQCEQTLNGKGCHEVGVCGKSPVVAALQVGGGSALAPCILALCIPEIQIEAVLKQTNRICSSTRSRAWGVSPNKRGISASTTHLLNPSSILASSQPCESVLALGILDR